MNKLAFAVAGSPAFAQAPASKAVPVTADNFMRGKSDAVFIGLVAQGRVGKFFHNRKLQSGNRDSLYSTAVFDLGAAPATITLPNVGSGSKYFGEPCIRALSARFSREKLRARSRQIDTPGVTNF